MINNKKLFWITLGVSVVCGISIGLIDTSHNWDDSGISAFLILSCSFILGSINPKYAWASALALGGIIFLFNIFKGGNWGSFVVLVISFIGAYAGFGIRRLVSSPLDGKSKT